MNNALQLRQRRIDWFRVIVDLERNGYPQRAIAAHVGRAQGWVQHHKEAPGAEPRHDDGEAMLALWSIATGREAADVPRLEPSINR